MSIDLISSTEKESAGVLTASGFADDWYLNAYKVSALENKTKLSAVLNGLSFGGWGWRKIALAGLLGVCAGLGIASLQIGDTAPLQSQAVMAAQEPRSELNTPSVLHQAITPVSLLPAARIVTSRKRPVVQSEEDIARLRIRNRRLEALVKVLRQRPVEKRSVQEQTTFLGQ